MSNDFDSIPAGDFDPAVPGEVRAVLTPRGVRYVGADDDARAARTFATPHDALTHYVSGAVARGEATPIVAIEADADDDAANARLAADREAIAHDEAPGMVPADEHAALVAAMADTTPDPNRIEIPAYMDEWMMGDRYGVIVGIAESFTAAEDILIVKLDKSGRRINIRRGDLA